MRSSNGQWDQQAKLIANDAAASDNLGSLVAISGDTIVAGAPGVDTQLGENFGAVYVFVRNNGQWDQQAKLLATVPPEGVNDVFPSSAAISGDTFGHSVSVSGDTIVVGAPIDNTAAGSIYIYTS